MKKLILILWFLIPLFTFGQNEWLISRTIEASKNYKAKFLTDGGKLVSDNLHKAYFAMSEKNDMATSIQFGWMSSGASATANNGTYSYLKQLTKAYSFYGTNHATQTTSASQPFITGNIAPNEKWGMKNVNGGARFMTHPTISFAANEAWSVTTGVNWDGDVSLSGLFGGVDAAESAFRLSSGNTHAFRLLTGTVASALFGNTKPIIGKNSVITICATGTKFDLYINGVYKNEITINTAISFSSFMFARTAPVYGSLSAHIIRSAALTATQVAAEAALLQSIYPAIPSVVIGTQTWQTTNVDVAATPQGSVIANVTAATNVEKVTAAADRDFSSDTGWWTKGAGVAISDGAANFTEVAAGVGLTKATGVTADKWHKVVFSVVATTGTMRYGTTGTIRSATGTYTEYIKVASSTIGFYAVTTFTGSIDNVSVEEVGWAGSQGLFDGIYAQTAGTVAEKTLAASKAAAFWRYPNNDLIIGSFANKLYNKFAASLIQQDIVIYNNANPTALWGWHVPTRAELTTLSAIGGNNAKVGGTNYWTTANGTNHSGLSAIGTGHTNSSGAYTGNKTTTGFLCSDDAFVRQIADGGNTFSEVAITVEGYSLRLIKD